MYLLPNIPNVNIIAYEYSGYTSKQQYYYKEALQNNNINILFQQQQQENNQQRQQNNQYINNIEGIVKPSEELLYSDIQVIYDYAILKLGIKANNIVLFGHSLGTGPTLELASKFEVGGVILSSAFASIYRVILNLRFDLPGDHFVNISKIQAVRCPILLIHGLKDEIVPFEHSVQLYNKMKIKYKPLWVKNGDHNNIAAKYTTRMFNTIQQFLKYIEHFKQNNFNQF